MGVIVLYSVIEVFWCVGVLISMDERYLGLDYWESLYVD